MAKIEFNGNLAADAEVRQDRNGGTYSYFRVFDKGRRREDGQGKDQVLSCFLRGPLAEATAAHLHKGVYVTVFGEFMSREYEGKNGPGVSLDVTVDAVKVWPPRNREESRDARDFSQAQHPDAWANAQAGLSPREDAQESGSQYAGWGSPAPTSGGWN